MGWSGTKHQRSGSPIHLGPTIGVLIAIWLVASNVAQVSASTFLTCAELTSATLNSPAQPQVNQWIQIPQWLGGTWQAKSELIVTAFDHRQGRYTIQKPVKLSINRISVIGAQRDTQGNLWHYIGVPFTRTINTGSFWELQKIEKVVLLTNGPSELSVSCLATVTRIERRGRDTLDLFKEETITTYTPFKDDSIHVTFVTKDFDMQGRPIFSSTETCVEKRIEPFRVVNQDNRGDLREKFRQFLTDNGMGNLLEH